MTVLGLLDLGKTLVDLQGVTAGRDEIDHVVEIVARKMCVWRRLAHLGIKFVGQKRRPAGAAEHVLRQDVERAGAQRRGILGIFGNRLDRRRAFQNLEPICRHQHPARGFVHAVVGAADTLQESARPLGRADVDHEIDVAPVDPEIERGGADDRAQSPRRHRAFNLAALGNVERTVVECNREAVVVDPPQRLKDHLGLHARVDEHQRRGVALDQIVDVLERVAGRVPGPRQFRVGIEHRDDWRGTALRHDQVGLSDGFGRLRHQITAKLGRLGDGSGEPDARHLGRHAK